MFALQSLIKFACSFLMVFVSSYSFSCAFLPENKKDANKYGIGFIIFLLLGFAQIVLTFEILSLFNLINEKSVLITNAIFLLISIFCWIKSKKSAYFPKVMETLKRIFKGLRRDKILMIMAFGFLFFIVVSIFLCLIVPISNYDALTYHLNRSSVWMNQGNLNHFITSDERNLVMPINSEILYLWVLLFFKNDIGLRFFSFFGYLASIFSVYNILALLGFSERKKLWSVFILSSFAAVLAEASSLETDVLISGLVLLSILLFLVSLKQKRLSLIFFSSLSYALAMGTKSPAIIAFPGVFLLLSFFSYKSEKKEFFKPVLCFLGFLFLNFVIFSSYNYILNFIDYGDFLGSESAKKIHGFRGGFKAIVANYIRYIFMMFDFSGFRYSDYVGEHINNLKFAIFNFLQIPQDWGVEMPDDNIINNGLLEVKMGTGLLGFLLFLPSAIASAVMMFINKNKPKIQAMFAFAAMFFVNVFCLSFSLAYMVFSVRFLTFLVVISSPVLAISYITQKNIVSRLIKLLILYFVMSYFLVMSTNLTAKEVKYVVRTLLEERTLNNAREKMRCGVYFGYTGKMSFCYIRDLIKTTPKGTSFGVFSSSSSRLYLLNMLNFEGYKIDTLLPEDAESYDLSDYDYLLTTDTLLMSNVLKNKTKDTKAEYKLNDKGIPYFDPPRDLQCLYINHNTIGPFVPGKDGQVIVQSTCYMRNSFFEKRGFKMLQQLNFHSDIKDNSNFMTIYKNMNKEN